MKKNIEVLLVIPHQPHTAEILSGPSGITQPLGIGYIASYLEKNGISVKVLDNSVENLGKAEFQDFLRQTRPLCVGFSVCTSSYNNALYLARLVKDVESGIYVVMGGAQPSALACEVLKNNSVDIVVKGEGEETFLELTRRIKQKESLEGVAGLIFKQGQDGRIVENPDRPLITDIDALDFPAYHLMPMEKYSLPASRRLTNKKSAAIVTSRGCPYACLFCSHNSIFKGKVRLRSAENVVAEIRHLVEHYDIGELLIWDDSFLLNKNRAVEICRLIRAHKLI